MVNRLVITDLELVRCNKTLEEVVKQKLKCKPLEIIREPIWRAHFVYYEEGKMEKLDWYYKLNKDDRWLESAYEIGGRSTDVSQIAYSLESRIRELYPINCVPADVVRELAKVRVACQRAEIAIGDFIGFYSERKLRELNGKQ